MYLATLFYPAPFPSEEATVGPWQKTHDLVQDLFVKLVRLRGSPRRQTCAAKITLVPKRDRHCSRVSRGKPATLVPIGRLLNTVTRAGCRTPDLAGGAHGNQHNHSKVHTKNGTQPLLATPIAWEASPLRRLRSPSARFLPKGPGLCDCSFTI